MPRSRSSTSNSRKVRPGLAANRPSSQSRSSASTNGFLPPAGGTLGSSAHRQRRVAAALPKSAHPAQDGRVADPEPLRHLLIGHAAADSIHHAKPKVMRIRSRHRGWPLCSAQASTKTRCDRHNHMRVNFIQSRSKCPTVRDEAFLEVEARRVAEINQSSVPVRNSTFRLEDDACLFIR